MLKNPKPDFRGARGSNTGDDYHELWAMRQALRLLERDGELTALKLEGMTSDLPESADWDGVDCMLMFGGDRASTATRVEIQQLKYSAAHPEVAWTVARVCAAPKGKKGASVIGRLASAFHRLKAERQSMDVSSLSVRLVSNQPIGSDLAQALADAKQMAIDRKLVIGAGKTHLRTLRDASGLKADEFIEFADRLDLASATGSRFAIESDALKALAQWDDVEFVAIADSLRRYLHDLMLPERSAEIVTCDDVLLKIGAGDRQNLFPAPTAFIRLQTSFIDRKFLRLLLKCCQAGNTSAFMALGA